MLNLDKEEIDFECPSCGFYNDFSLKQARLRDVIICRGCKANIHLDDYMNEVRVSIRRLNKSLCDLENSFNNLNITIKI